MDYESTALTTELPPRRDAIGGMTRDRRKKGSGGGDRTHDLAVNSRLLCQLSYPGMCECEA
jgi:hypothetical protein